MWIAIDRPEGMPDNHLPRDNRFYIAKLSADQVERFKRGGELTLRVRESADELTLLVEVSDPPPRLRWPLKMRPGGMVFADR